MQILARSTEGTWLPPMLKRTEIVKTLGITLRTFERMQSRGSFPKPDAMLNKMPRWHRSTFAAWLEAGGTASA